MTTKDMDFYLSRAMRAGEPAEATGASGYFSSPQKTLDPRLFNGQVMKSEVRSFILDTLYGYWRKKYHRPESWSTVWAAGSGITYQWAGDRGNGDLDILIGVSFDRFYRLHDSYRGLSQEEMATIFNDEFRKELWPTTANWNGFEVTFYVNPGAEDIRAINPYAAYSITEDSWTVRPPLLPEDPASLYPEEFWKSVREEEHHARGLIDRFHTYRAQAEAMQPGTPGWKNAMAAQRLVVDQARTLFDSIHLGRRQAFSPGGSGYGDYYNFRWQAHKKSGVVQQLHGLADIGSEARKEEEQAMYGTPLKSATAALTEAALWRRQ